MRICKVYLHYRMNTKNTIRAVSREIAAWMKQEERSQTVIAQAVGVHQSQVSRIIRGDFKCLSPHVLKLCAFAGIDVGQLQAQTNRGGSKRLQQAVAEIWDGSSQHEEALVKVITSLRHLQ